MSQGQSISHVDINQLFLKRIYIIDNIHARKTQGQVHLISAAREGQKQLKQYNKNKTENNKGKPEDEDSSRKPQDFENSTTKTNISTDPTERAVWIYVTL